jgi:hypothetical protein
MVSELDEFYCLGNEPNMYAFSTNTNTQKVAHA